MLLFKKSHLTNLTFNEISLVFYGLHFPLPKKHLSKFVPSRLRFRERHWAAGPGHRNGGPNDPTTKTGTQTVQTQGVRKF